MPIFTVTIDDGNGNTKTVTVDTAGMVANVVPKEQAAIVAEQVNKTMGGKRSAPSFRLKKRRITRKLKKTR